jgi:hypothetical protein
LQAEGPGFESQYLQKNKKKEPFSAKRKRRGGKKERKAKTKAPPLKGETQAGGGDQL